MWFCPPRDLAREASARRHPTPGTPPAPETQGAPAKTRPGSASGPPRPAGPPCPTIGALNAAIDSSPCGLSLAAGTETVGGATGLSEPVALEIIGKHGLQHRLNLVASELRQR